MPSVARGRPESDPSPPPAAPPGGALPAALEQRRGRVLAVVVDVARLALAGLVGGLARRLGGQAAGVPLAVLEVEVRDALLALGAALLTELVRLRGTGDRGPSYVCPCGVRLLRKEVAPLRQRTWCGEVTLERTVYAGAGCAVRAHHVPLDAAWGLLGAAPAAGLPEPDGGALAPAAPGPGPARLAPAFAAAVAEFGARLPYAEAARLLEVALGASARLAPNTVRAYTRAAGRARQEQEAAALAGRRRLTRGEVRAASSRGTPPRPAAAPDVLAVALDGALERTHRGLEGGQAGRGLRPGGAPRRGGPAAAGARAGARAPRPTRRRWPRPRPSAASCRPRPSAAGWAGPAAWPCWGTARSGSGSWPPGASPARCRSWTGTTPGSTCGPWPSSSTARARPRPGPGWRPSPASCGWPRPPPTWTWSPSPPRRPGPPPAAGGAPRRTKARRREVAQAIAYFVGNAPRMRYAAVRAAGLPVGSGMVEGGCHSVLHVRLKRPGARWAVESAERMVRARAVLCSDPAPVCSHPADRLAA